MWIIDGILAGLIAGIIMGIFSQLGYWFGVVKSHLIVVDGAFGVHALGRCHRQLPYGDEMQRQYGATL